MTEAKRDPSWLGLFFEEQWLHACGLIVLLSACYLATQLPEIRQGQLWGISSSGWFWIAMLTAVVHQLYVWLCWRLELHGGHLTRTLGLRAFGAYAFGFAIIGISRVLTVFLLAYANQGSFSFDPLLLKIAAIVALLPALYLFYSVKRYFSFTRALGAD
ncbi:MAG: hypothetical protein GY798_32115, partial [Hyphomicrobiales bacterium]|nr:hypothetical protein [Hyphomicrobiales bacterium]